MTQENHSNAGSPADPARRTWIAISCAAGGAGAAAVAVPFVASFSPSEKARAAGAPVEIDIGNLQPGEMITTEWRGKPVWVVRRTPEHLAALEGLKDRLADPDSQRNPDALTPRDALDVLYQLKKLL